MIEPDSVGARLRRYIKTRRLTYDELAARSGVSVSTIKKLTAPGVKTSAPSAFTVGKLAAGLNIDASKLYANDEFEQTLDIVPILRRTLAATDLMGDDIHPEPLSRLRSKVEQVGKWRRGTQYKKISAVLPDLVDHLLVTGQDEGEPAYALLVDAYRAANSLAHKLGYSDLSMTATERMEWAAIKSGDPLRLASVHYLKAATLARIGATKPALRLLDRAMSEIEHMVGRDPTAAAVYSTLHMRAGTISATIADADSSRSHLAEAGRLAALFPEGVVYDTVVGPTNIALFRIAAEVDLGNAEGAVQLARATRLPKNFAEERKTYFWLDTARAHLQAGNPDEANEALLESRSVAPEHFKSSPTVRATVEAALERARYVSDDLSSLARTVGVK
jgi:transcriptional regulator with XRE-family HTH domain